uniref:Uncharacterized protein n=1 Tax=Arundo donax TaxID=35708 RepID=A0A0A9CYB6_ARUDO
MDLWCTLSLDIERCVKFCLPEYNCCLHLCESYSHRMFIYCFPWMEMLVLVVAIVFFQNMSLDWSPFKR